MTKWIAVLLMMVFYMPGALAGSTKTSSKAINVKSVIEKTSQSKRCVKKKCADLIVVDDVKELLWRHQDVLNPDVINTVSSAITCANNKKKWNKKILTVIDYSLPSDKKRLYVFDLEKMQLLYHTYVSHGIKSGSDSSYYFSNINNSKTSSLGVYSTDISYKGRYGLAVRLNGLENGFNSNAWRRAIVIHPAWYVTEDFIHKYGRLGRSWGCPAVSYDVIDPIINTIKEKSLIVVYYPSYEWLAKSRFLNCEATALMRDLLHVESMPDSAKVEKRDPIMFVDLNGNNKREDTDPILVMSAENYMSIFQKNAPLKRMLRRQISGKEFIALNAEELFHLDRDENFSLNGSDENAFSHIDFVVAKVRKVDWYYATEFHSVPLGKDLEIQLQLLEDNPQLVTSKKKSKIRQTNKFIRWLGL